MVSRLGWFYIGFCFVLVLYDCASTATQIGSVQERGPASYNIISGEDLSDRKRRQIFDSMSRDEQVAIAGDPPSFEEAKQWICTGHRGALLARYKKIRSRPLGEGSFGVVTKVIDTCDPDKAQWALKKFVAKEAAIKDGDPGSLEHELSILERLGHHENILSLERTMAIGNEKYALMRVMRGTLQSSTFGPMTLEIMKELMKQVVEAVYHAHSRKIAINDIKEENILVESVQPIKIRLADFGLATFLAKKTGRSGSPAYMPLEKFYKLKGGNSLSDDIWAIGMVMCYLLVIEQARKRELEMQYTERFIKNPKLPMDTETIDKIIEIAYQSTSGYGEIPADIALALEGELQKVTSDAEQINLYSKTANSFQKIHEQFPRDFKNNRQFISFLKSCLQFDRDTRATIEDLRGHPFLQSTQPNWVDHIFSWVGL